MHSEKKKRGRLYIAIYDDRYDPWGHGSFTFESTHKANSAPNVRDAERKAEQIFGRDRAFDLIITVTVLANGKTDKAGDVEIPV